MNKNSPFVVTFTHRPLAQGQFSIVAPDAEAAKDGAEQFLAAQGVEEVDVINVQEVSKEKVQEELN